jgi:hypothetical protein
MNFFGAIKLYAQVQRTIEGTSIIRENIIKNSEFNFIRDWNKIAKFESGIGESVQVFPVKFSSTDGKTNLFGLQMYAFVKPQDGLTFRVSGNNVSGLGRKYKGFIQRSIFIDKEDVSKMITFIERDIMPNLKVTFKKKSQEYIYKCKEMFFSFLIDENELRITMHLNDYGPYGDGRGATGEQIEFWTESQVKEIPEFLKEVKDAYSKMK